VALLLTPALLLVGAPPEGAAPPPEARTHAAPAPDPAADRGLTHRVARSSGGVDVHVFHVDPARVELRLITPPEGRRSATVRQMAQASGALLACNASFFLEDYTPLGLLISAGRPIQARRRVDWGVFFVRGGRADVVHVRDWHDPPGTEFAVQAGPRLVVDGKSLQLKPQRARRTMLAVDRQGFVILAVSTAPLWLEEAADLLVALGARVGLNLDGGPSAQLICEPAACPPDGLRVDSFSPVANGIGVFPRAR